MSALERAVAQGRPGVALRALAVHDDEVVLAGGDEVFRLPLTPDGETPFLAEPLLPGEPADALGPLAVGQLAGVLAALAAAPEREAHQWGVTGEGVLLHGALDRTALLLDPARGVLTGLVGWRPRLGEADDDLALLPEAVRAALG